MSTQTQNLTAAGASAAVSVQPGQSIVYSSTGTFTGFLSLKRSRTQGATYETVEAPAVDTNFAGATLKNETNAEERYRVEIADTDAVTPVTGTATTVLTDVNDVAVSLKDQYGRVYAQVKDDGIEFPGTVEVAGALTVAGVLTSIKGVEDTLTAHAGGTQAAALALSSTARYHRITVCATAGDSVILPAATVGEAHFIRNDGATSAQVFAALTETINGVASATGVPLGSGSGVWYVCTTAGKWTTAAGDELDGKWQVNASGALLPNTNATYDIGNGASDPRDINITRDVISSGGVAKFSGGVGAKNGATVVATEYGDGVLHKTVLTLTATPVTITDDAGVAQYGGTGKIYDFPEGLLLSLGAVAAGSLTLGTTGTIIDTWAGGVALGTETATTGSTLVGTEADIMPEVDIAAAVAKVGTIDAVSVATALTESGARWLDGTAAAKDLFLNFVVDDDVSHTSGTGTFTGTVTITWINLGDN